MQCTTRKKHEKNRVPGTQVATTVVCSRLSLLYSSIDSRLSEYFYRNYGAINILKKKYYSRYIIIIKKVSKKLTST